MSNLTTKEHKKENIYFSIAFNVVIPILILSKLSQHLGAKNALLLALFFPLFYAIYDYVKRRQLNPISILGFVSVLLKGTFALYQLDGFWFALQEAAIPCFLGVYTILSAWFHKPLVNYFIYNENIFQIERLEAKLKENKTESAFQILIWQLTMVFGLAFFLGGLLNYILAINIIVSHAGSVEFNQELAKMTFLSYGVVVIPKMIITIFGLWWFIARLKKLTQLNLNEILKDPSA